MIRKKPLAVIAVSLTAALTLAACSSGGGREETEGDGANAGTADTPSMTVAMITHQAPGDTFWDIIRKGAEAAAAKDNIQLEYSNDPDATKQAQLIQAAIDKKVDGIAVTVPNTPALGAAIKAAVAAGIPVTDAQRRRQRRTRPGCDRLLRPGRDGRRDRPPARRSSPRAARTPSASSTSRASSSSRTAATGVAEGAAGATVERLYVNGRDDSAVTTTIQAKLHRGQGHRHRPHARRPVRARRREGARRPAARPRSAPSTSTRSSSPAIKDGKVGFAIDQQPYLQGYLAVDALWLFKTNGNTIGGGSTSRRARLHRQHQRRCGLGVRRQRNAVT